jgi:RNase P subunit RPR2
VTYCNGCDSQLDPRTDTHTDPLTRDTSVTCPRCGWSSNQQETRGQLGPELEMEAVA